MISRDYTKEVGLSRPGRAVSWPVAVICLGTFAVALWLGIRAQGPGAARISAAEPAPAQIADR